MKFLRSTFAFPLLALTGVLVLAACDDDPVGTDDEEHADPVAVQVLVAGNELASATPVSATGSLTVDAGAETGHLDVVFIDEDGDAIVPEAEYSLAVSMADETVAEWEFDDPGEFGGHLKGLAAGTTTAVFSLMHDDHADFISAGVTVVIN
jgi:hypothetical protein